MVSLFSIWRKISLRVKHQHLVADAISLDKMPTMTGNCSSSTTCNANDSNCQEFYRYSEPVNYTLTYVQSFILLTGLPGNLLALIVINKKSMRSTSSAVFITYMAIFDSAVLLLHAGNLVRPRRKLILDCASKYLTDVFTCCANWILVIITLGQYRLFGENLLASICSEAKQCVSQPMTAQVHQ